MTRNWTHHYTIQCFPQAILAGRPALLKFLTALLFLIIGASLSEPLSCESAACPPIYIYIYICLFSIFRPTIWPTFSTSGAIVRPSEGRKLLSRRQGRPEKDVDALFETIEANFRTRWRFFLWDAVPIWSSANSGTGQVDPLRTVRQTQETFF